MSEPPVRLEVDQGRVGWLWFADPERKVNVLTDHLMRLLGQLVSEIPAQNLRGLVLSSRKPGVFLAGADISLFEKIATVEEGERLSAEGQEVFRRLSALPMPTVAAVDGVCLGGGLELALSCDWVVASSGPKTRLGLPEVRLGVLPGLGGTQRLPARVGLVSALDLILTGRDVDSRQALKMGLVDEACPPALLAARSLARLSKGKRPRRKGFRAALERSVLSEILFALSRKRVLKETRGHYPAPLAALAAVRTGCRSSDGAGYAQESRAFGELATSPVSRNLVRLFFLKERFTKPPEGHVEGMPFGKAQGMPGKAAVLGAGVMGGGIAHLLASKGIRVRLKDIALAPLSKALATAQNLNKRLERRGLEGRIEARDILNRISATSDNTGLADAAIAIEAVVENLDLKRKVFQELESILEPEAILATNTSSLPIEEISRDLSAPERAVGLHFFNPVHRMPLVEVIPSERTSRETLASVVAVSCALGKVPVVVADRPGFLVNRILLPYVLEAARIWEEGPTPEAIDRALLDFGMPMGPLELSDAVGLDVGAKVAHVLEEAFGDRMRAPAVLSRLIALKHLGQKSGAGFYVYEKGNPKPRWANPALSTFRAEAASAGFQVAASTIVDRCVLMMVNEAARCLEEKICESPEALDLAMVFGTGFPPFRGGLWKYAQDRGLPQIRTCLAELSGRYGPRFEPAPSLEMG